MRVAILGQFPLDITRLGGVEVAIVYLKAALRSAGVDDLHIISCRSELSAAKTTTVRDAVVHYLPRQNQGRMAWHLREVGRMRSLLRELRPDIVHGHGTGLYAGDALTSGFPSVITAHGIVAREVALYQGAAMRVRGTIDVLCERYCLNKARDIIAISPYAQEVFQPLTRARFHLIENAVDHAFFQIAPQPEHGRILYAGAIIERKGHIPLVRALAALKQSHPHIELRIAGGAPDERYYQSLLQTADALGVRGDVNFLGLLDQARLLDEYARCSLFVLPSFQETAPMALQQALAAGAPVVATPVGGVLALVKDGVTGLLAEVGNGDALAAALLRLLDDERLRTDMGARGRADAAARFMPEIMARKTKDVYDGILAGAGP